MSDKKLEIQAIADTKKTDYFLKYQEMWTQNHWKNSIPTYDSAF